MLNTKLVAPKRSAGQVFVGCWVTDALVAKINAVRGGSVSQFLRDSIGEKLAGMGIVIAARDIRPPERGTDGDGDGDGRFAFGPTPAGGVIANDARNSSPTLEAARRLAEQSQAVPADLLKMSKPKPKGKT